MDHIKTSLNALRASSQEIHALQDEVAKGRHPLLFPAISSLQRFNSHHIKWLISFHEAMIAAWNGDEQFVDKSLHSALQAMKQATTDNRGNPYPQGASTPSVEFLPISDEDKQTVFAGKEVKQACLNDQ